MLNDNIFYHGTIRKTIVAFGRLFSNIYIDRKQGDSVSGTLAQRLIVPITYAPKEKWLVRIEQDPDLTNNVQVSLPRMSFEITGYGYDSSRKVSKMSKVMCNTPNSASNMYSPVPYNIDISLYVITRTQEDGLQIIEQILPTFAPEYTLAVNAVPAMNIIQDVPVLLSSINVSDEYDGDFETRRLVTHTLTFTLKINLFGPVLSSTQIHETTTRVSTDPTYQPVLTTHNAVANPVNHQITTDEWIEGLD